MPQNNSYRALYRPLIFRFLGGNTQGICKSRFISKTLESKIKPAQEIFHALLKKRNLMFTRQKNNSMAAICRKWYTVRFIQTPTNMLWTSSPSPPPWLCSQSPWAPGPAPPDTSSGSRGTRPPRALARSRGDPARARAGGPPRGFPGYFLLWLFCGKLRFMYF